MSSKIWLSSPHLSSTEIEFVTQSMIDSDFSTYGKNIIEFENELGNFLGEGSRVTALSSGTAAIHIALILSGVSKGDEVICQSFTFAASAFPILYLEAKPIFVGSEKQSWNMCPRHLENAILDRIRKGNKPKAIIFVNSYGMPAQINEIISLAKKYDIKLIEDAAESLGSEYYERKCGNFGDFSVFSFNSNKIITTSGGGALVTRSQKHKELSTHLATQAKNNKKYYEHNKLGYNYRLSDVLAAIGRGQMRNFEKILAKKRENNIFYKTLFLDSKNIKLLEESQENIFSNHWLNCILIENNQNFCIEDIIIQFEKENIETKPLWLSLHLQPIFKDYPYYGDKFNLHLFNKGLCLPSSSNLSDKDKERVIHALSNFI